MQQHLPTSCQSLEAEALRVIQSSTLHFDNTVRLFENVVVPAMACRQQGRRLLEIGPGSGTTAMRLLPFFDEAVVIEPNPNCFQHEASNLTVLRDHFMSAATSPVHTAPGELLAPGSFDFILCSHVMYHIPPEDCSVWLRQMLQLLRPGTGHAMIILTTEQCANCRLHALVGATYTNSSTITAVLQQESVQALLQPGSVHVVTIPNPLSSTSKDAILQVLLYFLSYDCAPSRPWADIVAEVGLPELRRRAEQFIEQRGGSEQGVVYSFTEDVAYITIQRAM